MNEDNKRAESSNNTYTETHTSNTANETPAATYIYESSKTTHDLRASYERELEFAEY